MSAVILANGIGDKERAETIMAEYSIGFSESLIQAADLLTQNAENSFERRRTVLYLCLLASEIALKAILEKAGIPVPEIVRLSHRLDDLMHKVGTCEVPYQVSPTVVHWLRATSINAKTFRVGSTSMTVGRFLTVDGAADYPTDVRYGDHVIHFPPDAALTAAKAIVEWAHTNWDTVRRRAT